MSENGTRQLLTADQVADLIGMSTDWIYAQVRANRIPHVRLGRYVRFRHASIEQWITELETDSTNITSITKRRGAAATAPGMAPKG